MNANHFAAFIAYICALLAGLFACDENKSRRYLYLGAFCFALYPLFFSYSRGAYGAVLLAVLVVALTRQRKFLIPLAIFLVSWQAILPDTVVERITMTESADGDIEESAALRLVVWDLAKTLYAENPGLGIGFEGFWFASAHLPLRNAHNYFLQVAAEQGTVGLLLLATILIRAALSAAQLYRQAESPIMRGLGLGFAAMICAMVVANLFGDRFSMLEMGSYFWLLLGAVDRARQTAGLPVPSPAANVAKSVA